MPEKPTRPICTTRSWPAVTNQRPSRLTDRPSGSDLHFDHETGAACSSLHCSAARNSRVSARTLACSAAHPAAKYQRMVLRLPISAVIKRPAAHRMLRSSECQQQNSSSSPSSLIVRPSDLWIRLLRARSVATVISSRVFSSHWSYAHGSSRGAIGSSSNRRISAIFTMPKLFR